MRRLALFLVLAACGGAGPSVTRVVDGRPIEGRFVPPVAYELFLRGAIEAETGQLDSAIQAFEQTARLDPSDALVWTKLAETRCKKDVHDARIRVAIDKALELDPEFGPAHALLATCSDGGPEAARRAISAEPKDVPIATSMQDVLAAHPGAEDDARDRLTALALARPAPAAWLALYEWGNAHSDDALSLMAALQLAHGSASSTSALVDRAKLLAGDGALVSARTLAAALIDGPGRVTDALVARMAIDDGLAHGDRDAALRRAGRTHVPLSEVAARALAIGEPAIAREVANLVVSADPSDVSARLVLAAAGEANQDLRVVQKALVGAQPSNPPNGAAELVFARALARVGSDAVARSFAAAPVTDLLGGDALLVPLAVDLAARGVIGDRALPVEARIELALRNDDRATLETLSGGDARHRLAALVWTAGQESSPAVKSLAIALAKRSPNDPLVRASVLHLLATAEPSGAPAVAGALDLLRLDPSDPIALASSLRVLSTSPASVELTRAKARLAAVAVTPHELQLAY